MRSRFLLLVALSVFVLATITIFHAHTMRVQQYTALISNTSFDFLVEEEPNSLLKLRQVLNCHEEPAKFSVSLRGNFVVLTDFVKATRRFDCHETVTFTAPADFTFLDNLITLAPRWKAPISVALYAPGDDFHATLKSIAYLRNCPSAKAAIREFVTFHVFLHLDHVPKPIGARKNLVDSYVDAFNCSLSAPYSGVKANETYRRAHNLTFPINVARNIARSAAQTHYVFAADIELYPSANFTVDFMGMLAARPEFVRGARPRVFVLPVFEVEQQVHHVPENKTHLQQLYKAGKAFLFHRRICSSCHAIPNLTEWIDLNRDEDAPEMDVFYTAKRTGKQRVWEAFYVGTRDDPPFDERLTWEGQGNKMPQGFSMCVLNYDYMILNNAFIIHKPGIKKFKEQVRKFEKEIAKSNKLISKVIKPQLIHLYGDRKGCYL